MKPLGIAPETITHIFGQLNRIGDPDELGRGYQYQNGIQGQIELPASYGGRDLRSTLLQYHAEVVENDGELEWQIKAIILPESPKTKLVWQSPN